MLVCKSDALKYQWRMDGQSRTCLPADGQLWLGPVTDRQRSEMAHCSRLCPPPPRCPLAAGSVSSNRYPSPSPWQHHCHSAYRPQVGSLMWTWRYVCMCVSEWYLPRGHFDTTARCLRSGIVFLPSSIHLFSLYSYLHYLTFTSTFFPSSFSSVLCCFHFHFYFLSCSLNRPTEYLTALSDK